jgi:LysM repeat protein
VRAFSQEGDEVDKPARGPSECVNCGARLSPGERRCPTCGALVAGGRRQRRCLNCGTPAAQQAKTCLMCGAPLDRMPARGGLSGVSLFWVGVVALVAALAALGWNRWRGEQPAQVVVVPAASPSAQPPLGAAPATPTPTQPPTATTTPSATLTLTPEASATPIVHVVKSGETIIYIASYYGTSSDAIMKANGLDEAGARMLHIGQELVIPSTGPVGGPQPEGNAKPPQVIHEVASGETLSSIADKYDTSVESILAANKLSSPDLIYQGQELVVPLMPPTATPTPTPTSTLTPTPGPPFPAPALLSPADNAVFNGPDAAIVLDWASVGILNDDQVYLVEVETPIGKTPLTYTTQGTSWRLSADLWPSGQQQTLKWRVTVVGREDTSSEEQPVWRPLSPPAEWRRFVWQ